MKVNERFFYFFLKDFDEKSFLFCLALKIHITAEMNEALSIVGGFKTEHRGLIDVKVRKTLT